MLEPELLPGTNKPFPALIKELVANHPTVPQDNLSEFLDRVWARLPASELYEPEEFLKIMEPIFQPATYDPKLFLDEEGSLLTLEVQNTYETVHGEFTLPGPNPDFQTGSYVLKVIPFWCGATRQKKQP